MTYSVIVANTVEKQLDELPEKMKLRVLGTIAELAETPRPSGVKEEKSIET